MVAASCYSRFLLTTALLSSCCCFGAEYTFIPLPDINPYGDSAIRNLTRYGDELYFVATGLSGREVYRTNGKEVTRVTNINPNGDSHVFDPKVFEEAFIEFNDRLLFAATDGNNPGLYQTDGTLINRIATVDASFFARRGNWIKYDDKIYFEAEDNNGDDVVYYTDGSSLVQFSETNNGGNNQGLPFSVIGDSLYIRTGSRDEGKVFKTDGKNVLSELPFGDELQITSVPIGGVQEYLLFVSEVRDNDEELFSYDGNTISIIEDLNPNYDANNGIPQGGSNPSEFTFFNHEWYFTATDGTGEELYKTNGETIDKVADLRPIFGSSPYNLFPHNDELYFFANNRELYKTDGIDTTLIEILPSSSVYDTGPSTQRMVAIGDDIIFRTGGDSSKLYKTNGIEVVELGSELEFTRIDFIETFEGEIYFQAFSEQTSKRGLYVTDGDSVRLLADSSTINTTIPPTFFYLDGEILAIFVQKEGQEIYRFVPVPEPSSSILMLLSFFFLTQDYSVRRGLH